MWTTIAVIAVLVVLVWLYRTYREPYEPSASPSELLKVVPATPAAPVSPTPVPVAPTPMPVPTTRGDPLSTAMSRVIEPAAAAAAPGTGLAPGEEVPYDKEEVHNLMGIVVGRINERDPELELHLITVDAIRKTVDPYKTLNYEADMTVYSKGRNVTSRVAVAVSVALSGRVVVRRLAMQSAAKDTSTLMAASDAEPYAAFEPALAY